MPDADTPPAAVFFATPADFRAWLAAHHATERALLVGFHKQHTGQPSVTWPEAVDEALCFGWIDGVRRRLDDARYVIRFTPRQPRSIWSAVNIARVAELTTAGRMQPAGLRIFADRAPERTDRYSYEQAQPAALDAAEAAQFQADPAAWAFFQSRPPAYQRAALWWVVSAKQPATRAKRLATLLADSAAGRTLAHLTRRPRTE